MQKKKKKQNKKKQEAFIERRHLHVCDLDLTSRSRKLMSLNVAYCIVPWYLVCECNSLQDMTIYSFFVTFDRHL